MKKKSQSKPKSKPRKEKSGELPAEPKPMLYLALAEKIEAMIRAGALRAGERIPSVRQTSHAHGVSMPTVVAAYLALENRQLIEARPRSGFYVRTQASPKLRLPTFTNHAASSRSLSNFPPLMAMVSDVANADVVPLGGANPSGDLLPARKLARIAGSVSRQQPKAAINYDPAPGCARLRHELSRRSLGWGCYLGPEDFIVTGGATEALHLALSAVAKPGDTVMVESPTYYGLLNLLSFLQLKVLAVPSRAESGIDLAAAERALARNKVAAIVLIPNFSNPLGSLMPDAHRRRMLGLAARHRVPIIEDDIHGDLNHEGERPRALKALDKEGPEGTVLLCGSFSKTLAPGYRTGYLVAGRHHEQLVQAKTAMNFSGAPLPALTIAEFLRDGGYDHHLRTLRRTYAAQVARMRAAVEVHFPEDVKISDPAGGFVLWVELTREVDAMVLFHQAREAGISIAPGHLFSPTRNFTNCIRLNCGHPWSAKTEAAIETLGRMIRGGWR